MLAGRSSSLIPGWIGKASKGSAGHELVLTVVMHAAEFKLGTKSMRREVRDGQSTKHLQIISS